MTTELTMLVWTIVLGFVQLFTASSLVLAGAGMAWGLSSRDAPPAGKSLTAGRAERAFNNLLETFPFAAAAILIAHVAGRHNGLTVWGAELYFWGRLAYFPIYVAGIAGIRTAAFGVSVVGIVLVLLGLRWG